MRTVSPNPVGGVAAADGNATSRENPESHSRNLIRGTPSKAKLYAGNGDEGRETSALLRQPPTPPPRRGCGSSGVGVAAVGGQPVEAGRTERAQRRGGSAGQIGVGLER